jgi:hypothetical protein
MECLTLIESANTDILIAFIGILALLPAIAAFDRYLIRRQGSAVNAAFIVWMQAGRTSFHRRLRSAKANRDAPLQPKLLPAAPTLLMLTSGRA